jgi:hypothetical protein
MSLVKPSPYVSACPGGGKEQHDSSALSHDGKRKSLADGRYSGRREE